jgi:uncharacterized membrane protein
MSRIVLPVVAALWGGMAGLSEILGDAIPEAQNLEKLGFGAFALLLLYMVNRVVNKLLDTNDKMSKSLQELVDHLKSCPFLKKDKG